MNPIKIIFLLLFLLSGSESFSQNSDEYDEELILPKEEKLVNVIQKKHYLKKHKLEITPKGGIVVNDNYIRILSGGASLAFYLSDYWAIELEGLYINSTPTVFVSKLKKPESEGGLGVMPEYSREYFTALLGVQWCPLYGKMSFLADKIIPYDMYLFLRGGLIGTKIGSDSVITETGAFPVGNLGLGQRYFIHRFFVLKFDIGFNVFNDKIANLKAKEGVPDGTYYTQLKVDFGLYLGLSFFIPPFVIY